MDGAEESEQVSSRRAKRVGKAIMVKEEDCGDGARMQAYRGLKREGVVQDKVEREKKSVADERESRIARISSKVRCARWRATMSRSPVPLPALSLYPSHNCSQRSHGPFRPGFIKSGPCTDPVLSITHPGSPWHLHWYPRFSPQMLAICFLTSLTTT